MGKLEWKGWQKSVEGAPQSTSVIYGANIRSTDGDSSSKESLVEVDYVVELLQKSNLPLTRENYLGLAYPEGAPDDLDESSLPAQIRNC